MSRAKAAVVHRAFEPNSRTVAFVDVGDRETMKALEHAYFRTQNIHDSWSLKMEIDGSDEVDVVGEFPVNKKTGQTMGIRSTSMGDKILLDGKTWFVDMFGFSEEETDFMKAQVREVRKQLTKEAA